VDARLLKPDGIDLIFLAVDTENWRAFVSTVMTFCIQ
jgi:hypothetical protein